MVAGVASVDQVWQTVSFASAFDAAPLVWKKSDCDQDPDQDQDRQQDRSQDGDQSQDRDWDRIHDEALALLTDGGLGSLA